MSDTEREHRQLVTSVRMAADRAAGILYPGGAFPDESFRQGALEALTEAEQAIPRLRELVADAELPVRPDRR